MDDHRRAARDRTTLEDDLAETPLEEEVPDPVDPALVAALAALSPDQREVVLLRFVGDLPLEAVARITGRRVGAVKALQHRALENLRRAVSLRPD
jgi:RNA polymerase sigma-70 factor (ECF subfamily)